MANKGRTYAENLVGALDRSAYNQQRDVAQNIYNTNWQNVQNQYKNLQDKLKLQQQRANAEYAEGLVNVAENSFNRERTGSGSLANRGLSASGLVNILDQANTAQRGEEISKLLKKSGGTSLETADKLSQATTKFAEEGTGLMGKLANTLGGIGDSETAMQNRYNQTLANIAGAMDEREMNNALQAAQRELQRASMRASSSSGKSKELTSLENQIDEAYRKEGINKILSSKYLNDQQKANYLGIMFGINNAGNIVNTYNSSRTATTDYNKKLKELQAAAAKEKVQNRKYLKTTQDYFKKQQGASELAANPNNKFIWGRKSYNPVNTLNNINRNAYTPANYAKQAALESYQKEGITYQDLAELLYGNR